MNAFAAESGGRGAAWLSGTVADFGRELGAAAEAAPAGRGGEAFLLLDHEDFRQQMEPVPALQGGALRRYFAERVAANQGDCCWSCESTLPGRGEHFVLSHVLPAALHLQLTAMFHRYGLRLTRIFPLTAALQALAAETAPPDGAWQILAATAGPRTVLVTCAAGGRLAFARSFRADWQTEGERLGVEINRSIIYARQRWGATVGRVRLMRGDQAAAEAALLAVQARCSGCADITEEPLALPALLNLLAAVTAGDPRNVLSTHRRSARQRIWMRWTAAAACWAGVALVGLHTFSQAQTMAGVRRETAVMRLHAPALTAERDRLRTRNRMLMANRALISRVHGTALPPVPQRFLNFETPLLPDSARLSAYCAAWDGTRWTVTLGGRIAGDEARARTAIAGWQSQLGSSVWHVHFDGDRSTLTPGPDGIVFRMEGALFEN